MINKPDKLTQQIKISISYKTMLLGLDKNNWIKLMNYRKLSQKIPNKIKL